MTTDKRYNGWTNYETWAVKLWIDNEQASQEYWREEVKEQSDRDWAPAYPGQTHEQAIAYMVSEMLKDRHEEMAEDWGGDTCVFSDLLGAALSEVNWYEIAEALVDDVREEMIA